MSSDLEHERIPCRNGQLPSSNKLYNDGHVLMLYFKDDDVGWLKELKIFTGSSREASRRDFEKYAESDDLEKLKTSQDIDKLR